MFQQIIDGFAGRNEHMTWFIGICEDDKDPMTLGRVKVRCYGFHPESREDVPTKDLPWASVIQPTTSAAMGGVGWSPNGIKPGSMVIGFFMDGKYAQYPIIFGTIPGIHRPGAPGAVAGGDTGYLGGSTGPYHGQGTETNSYDPNNLTNTPSGEAIKDDGSYLTKANSSNWPLKYYKAEAGSKGLACKDGQNSLNFHYATALALERLTESYGKGALTINSAYRTEAYNARVGGARQSMHTKGRAIDISLASIGGRQNAARFAAEAVKHGFVGFGVYDTFIHIDTGTGRVWNGAKSQEFVKTITAAGWYPGKPGLSGVKVSPNTQTQTANNSGTTTSTNDKKSTTQKEASTRKEVEDMVREKYKAAGYSDSQINGVLANFRAESGMNPGILNPNDKGLPSFGLGQWRAERYDGLKSYASSRGLDYRDASTQIDYSLHELSTTHKSAANALKSASTPGEAAYAFGSKFEVHAGSNNPNSAESQKRIAYANEYAGGGSVGNQAITKGFMDPTNSNPSGQYRGAPSTHHAARGLNGNAFQPQASKDASARVTGVPIAGDKGTFGEPASAFNPKYPYNHTYSTVSGHLMEFDDSPGTERINFRHKSGSKLEFTAKGTTLKHTVGNNYDFSMGDSFTYVNGNSYLTSKGDQYIRSTADMVIHSDGSMQLITRNDKAELVSGKYDIGVGETMSVKVGKLIIEADEIDFYSKGDFKIQAEGVLNLKAKNIKQTAQTTISIKGENARIQADSEVSVKTQTVVMDDVVRMAQGLSKDAEVAADAKSTDLGKVPSRRKIEKQPDNKEHPDAIDGFEEGMRVYGA